MTTFTAPNRQTRQTDRSGRGQRPINASKLSLAALAARAHWLTVEWLPKYAPGLNDIEVVWHDLKAHHLAHQTFTDSEDLDHAIHAAVRDINRERMINPLAKLRIPA